MYLARSLTPNTLEQIGRYFGGRDHTTVSHGCRKTAELIENDPSVRQAVLTLRGEFGRP
jgi:chromosomal replication initiator protein